MPLLLTFLEIDKILTSLQFLAVWGDSPWFGNYVFRGGLAYDVSSFNGYLNSASPHYVNLQPSTGRFICVFVFNIGGLLGR